MSFEYRYKKEKEISDEYAVCYPPNINATCKLLDMMRGTRSLERYAYESGVSTCVLTRTFSGDRTRPISFEICEKLYEHKDPDCNIPFDHWLIANGIIKKSDMEDPLDTMNCRVKVLNQTLGRNSKYKHYVKKKNTPEPIKAQVSAEPIPSTSSYEDGLSFAAADEYKTFLKNLSIYALSVPSGKVKSIHSRKEELYKNNWFIELLKTYVATLEEDEKANRCMLKNYFSINKKLEKFIKKSDTYKLMLDEALA